jgi:hypothetical protein
MSTGERKAAHGAAVKGKTKVKSAPKAKSKAAAKVDKERASPTAEPSAPSEPPESEAGAAAESAEAAQEPAEKATQEKRLKAPSATELVRRLKIMLDQSMRQMEEHLEDNKGPTTADEREHTVRAIGAYIRSFEKITEVKPVRKTRSAKADANATAALRRELAQRLYKLWGEPQR